MLTEPWPPEYNPALPPRWHHSTSPRPLVVYLDQWCFNHLSRDRAGAKLDKPSEEGCFDYFRMLALDGKVFFVLSQMHYRENWPRTNTDGRWDTAVTMAELTGFNTITTAGLRHWDALVAIADYTDMGIPIPTPKVFGWGHSHCISGKERTASIIDRQTGRRATWDHLPESNRTQLTELEHHLSARIELALLARRDPRMEPQLLPFAALPDDGKGALLIQEEHSIRSAIDQVHRNASNVRTIVEGRCFLADATQQAITEACQQLELGPDAIVDRIAAQPTATPAETHSRRLSKPCRSRAATPSCECKPT
ncbi:hypothetical protein [Nocardia sp. bgisy118]|uniref:hypothetical protein n=1 Tax=Nocardia sp. bgisy118 TaxID=3413786 RepID=UPI003F4A6291